MEGGSTDVEQANRDFAESLSDSIHDWMFNATPTSQGHAAGDLWAAKIAADKSNSRLQDARLLSKLTLGLDLGVADPAKVAGDALYQNPELYGGPGAPRFQSLYDINQALSNNDIGAAAKIWGRAARPLAAGAANLVLGPFSPAAANAVSTAVTLGAIEPAAARAGARATEQAQQAAINNAWPRMTGMSAPGGPAPPSPMDYPAFDTNALKALIFSQTANPQVRDAVRNAAGGAVQGAANAAGY